jgi:hypothetical protein
LSAAAADVVSDIAERVGQTGERNSLGLPRTADADDLSSSATGRHPPHPSVLCGHDADNFLRWQEGERLHHVFEQACDRFADSDAVVTDDARVS